MERVRRLGRAGKLLLAFGVAGAVFGIATAVQASIPDASGVIHGCYNQNGSLRVIDTSSEHHCIPGEKPLNWNQKGVSGATGPTGPTGATGPSDAWDALTSTTVPMPAPGFTTLISLSLPAGNFFVNATGSLRDNTNVDSFQCTLTSPSGEIDRQQSNEAAVGQMVQVHVQGTTTLSSPGTVSFNCAPDHASEADFVHIDAIKVGTLH
jgi:hypothetical protein